MSKIDDKNIEETTIKIKDSNVEISVNQDDSQIKKSLLFLRVKNILSEFEYNQKISLLNKRGENILQRSLYNYDDHKILVSVSNLTKHYKKRPQPAVDKISFNIRKGEFHVFIGANGAGKTTTIKAMVGAYAKYSGEILIDGYKNSTVAAKKRIGYVPEVAIFPKEFTTRNYLESMSIMSGLTKSEAKKFTTDKLIELNMLNLQNKKPLIAFVAGDAIPFGHKIGYIGDIMTRGCVTVQDKKDGMLDAGMIVVNNINDIHIELEKLFPND